MTTGLSGICDRSTRFGVQQFAGPDRFDELINLVESVDGLSVKTREGRLANAPLDRALAATSPVQDSDDHSAPSYRIGDSPGSADRDQVSLPDSVADGTFMAPPDHESPSFGEEGSSGNSIGNAGRTGAELGGTGGTGGGKGAAVVVGD